MKPNELKPLVRATEAEGKPTLAASATKEETERREIPPEKCAVLVLVGSHVERRVEMGLVELERRGYAVWRVGGYANVDLGRSQVATDALGQGFAETLWIDSDVTFEPDDVERVRAHGLPLVAGICAKKGPKELAAALWPDTKAIVFGREGGLLDIRYAGTGFMLVRREVYETMQRELKLPVCNLNFGRPVVPYFLPLVVETDAGPWYLGEDFSFCERARQCGYKILADTSIRLGHIGSYEYGWENAGGTAPRYSTYRFQVGK